MRRERSVQGSSDEKKSLSRIVASKDAATRTFANLEKETEALKEKKDELLSSIERLKLVESNAYAQGDLAKKWFRELEQEHAIKLANFRRELIIPPEFVREKEEITKSIEDAKNELSLVQAQTKEQIDSLKADEDRLNKEILKKKNQIDDLNKDNLILSKKSDYLNSQISSQEGLLSMRESTLSRLDSSISSKKHEEIDLDERIDLLKKESVNLSDLNKEKKSELSKTEKELEKVKTELENKTVSIISLAKREASVKIEEARVLKNAKKLGIPLNF